MIHFILEGAGLGFAFGAGVGWLIRDYRGWAKDRF